MSKFKKNSPGCGCCPPPTRAITGQINGCSSIGLDGATVDFSAGGVSALTLTCNSSGVYTGTIATGTYTQTVTETSGRLATSTTTGVVIAAGAGTATIPTRTMAVATGYACVTGCALPLSITLHYTDTLGSSRTLTNTTGGTLWVGSGVSMNTGKTITFTNGCVRNPTTFTCPPSTFDAQYNLANCFSPGGIGTAHITE